MRLDEDRRPPGKNKRARPWMLEIKYSDTGLGAKWGWIKWGMYRTEEEATKAWSHHQRTWAKAEVRVTNTTSLTSKTN
jgi:hypothetical protein